MRRALIFTALLALMVAAPAPSRGGSMSVIDGSEMVDYTRAPNFGVGSWVTYHAVSNSALGYHSDYFITLLIAGEEEFWGERCFWLETWTKDAGADTFYTASLISYSAFGDTAAVNHIGWFVRKTIQHLGADGEPEQMLNKRDATEFKLRAKDRNKRVEEGKETEKLIDTLGVDTVAVPRGRFRGPVVREINRLVENAFRGDSTIYYIRQETRTRKLAEAMPITRMVREDQTDVQRSKNWFTGNSAGATERMLEEAVGSTIMVGYGKGELTPQLVPRLKRTSIVQQDAAAHRPKPVAKPASTTKKTSG